MGSSGDTSAVLTSTAHTRFMTHAPSDTRNAAYTQHTITHHSTIKEVTDLLVSDLAHFEESAAGADVALLDLVRSVHNRGAWDAENSGKKCQSQYSQ
jgi:hypothetical protein